MCKDIYEQQKEYCKPKPKLCYGCNWNVCIMSSTKECTEEYCPIQKKIKTIRSKGL